MKLNNYGQSLVMFVFVIPIILLVLILVYDVGNAIYEKNRLSNTCYLAADYALDNIDTISDDDVINYIIDSGDKLNNISVTIDDGTIVIDVTKNINGVIGTNFSFDLIELKVKYVGSIKEGKKSIERIK